jgi:hypothetical protein
MKLFAAAALVLSLTAFSQTASADELVVGTQVTTAYYTDSSFDAVSEQNAYSEWALSGAWGFDRLAGLQLGLMFQAQPGRLEAQRFNNDLYLEWGRQRVLATAGWGIDLWRFRPNVSVGLGYAHQFLSLESSGPRLKDHTHDLAAHASAGLDLRIPARWGAVGLIRGTASAPTSAQCEPRASSGVSART